MYEYKIVSVEWSDIISISLLISSYCTIVFWFIVFLFPPGIKIPVKDEDEFQKYVKLAENTTS